MEEEEEEDENGRRVGVVMILIHSLVEQAVLQQHRQWKAYASRENLVTLGGTTATQSSSLANLPAAGGGTGGTGGGAGTASATASSTNGPLPGTAAPQTQTPPVLTTTTQSPLSATPAGGGRSPQVFRKYILSQYRNYEMMEHYLHRPQFFREQFLFPLPEEVKMKLVELYVGSFAPLNLICYLTSSYLVLPHLTLPTTARLHQLTGTRRYYGFDQVVVRELLGKKLNHRTRKDLDDVCEKTQTTLGSCRRQVPCIALTLVGGGSRSLPIMSLTGPSIHPIALVPLHVLHDIASHAHLHLHLHALV